MKLAAFILFSSLAFAQFPFPGGHSANAASPAMLLGPVDAYLDLHGTTATTTITTTILNTGTLGIANTANWAINGTAPVAATHQANCNLVGTPQVDGIIYATSHPSLAASFANSAAPSYITVSTPIDGFDAASFFGCVTINTTSISGLFDIARLHGNLAGHLMVAQLSTLKCAGSLGWDLETTSATGTHNSACISATNGSTYYYSGFWDTVNGNAGLAIFDSTGAQLGSTLTATGTDVGTGEDIGSADFGNAEFGTASGNNLHEQMMVRWSGGTPGIIKPINTTQSPVYWVAQSHNSHGSGTATTLTTTKALEEHAGDAVVVSCSNENASGQTTSVTNTAGETFTAAASVKSAANGQSISQWVTFPSSGHTSQTYTCNWPASQFSNIDVQILHGATAFDTGAVGNTASGANIVSGSFTPGTSNGSNVACAYIQAGQAITAGTNYFLLRTSASDSMGCFFRTSAPSSAQTATGIHSNTSASMITVGNYKP